MRRFLIGHDNAAVDINRPLALAAALLLGVIGPEVFIVQPGFVQGLVAHYSFSEQQAGYVASAEMWGLALTTLLMSWLASRVDWRKILLVSTLVVVAGNLGSLATVDPVAFAAWRFVAGLGCGVLVSLSFTMIGLTANPDRNFGYLIAAVLTYGAFGLWLMPAAFDLVGMRGVIVFFAVFPLIALPLLRHLPSSGEEQVQVESDAVDLGAGLRAMAVATMLVYFLAQGVVWAYLFLIGLAGGVDEQGVANGLTLSQFLGIGGALLAAAVGKRYGRLLPLCIGILGGILPLLFLYDRFSALQYAVVVGVYNFAWNMTHPYLLAAMASFDRGGRLVVHAVGAQMLGLAIGPAIAAAVLQADDYGRVVTLGIVLFFVSWALVLPPVLAQRRQARG
jgi:MFS family permease